jgi:hypothetical protein
LLFLLAFVLRARTWFTLLLVVVGAAAASDAFAYDAREVRSEYVANRTINTATQIDKSWSPSNSGDGVRVGKNFVMKGPGGRTVAAEASALLARGTVMRLAASAVPLLGAASLAYEVYDLYRIHAGADCGQALCFDPGVPEIEVSGYSATLSGTSPAWTCSGSSTVKAVAATVAAECAMTKPQYTSCPINNGYCYVATLGAVQTESSNSVTFTRMTNRYWCDAGNCGLNNGSGTGYPGTAAFVVPVTVSTVEQCASGGATGIDGKCATGEYSQPLTAQEAADIAMGYANAGHPDLAALTAEALGVVPLPITGDSGVEVGNVVPASLEGPVKTTTKLEGGETVVQTEAIGWDWSRDPLRKMEGKWAETKTTTKTVDGVVVSEQTESEEGATPDDKTELVNQCKLNPKSIGCAEFGEVPAAEAIPTVALPSSMDERITFGAETAACPADRPIPTTLAGTLYFSWEGPCMFADGIRPVVVGMAYLTAVLSFFGFARRD